jgi:Lipopolysaccharide-assembly, LptC-related
MTVSRAIRIGVVLEVIGFIIFVAYGIYNAGGDVPPPNTTPETKLTSGHAEGRRVDGNPSWSLDYDRVIASPDTTVATLFNVRHGELYKHGKPFMRMVAKHVVVNTLSNDFVVTGPLELVENDGEHDRRLTSDAANYSGALQTLTLVHPSKISSDGARVTVATATVNFRSGDMSFGPLVGHY